MGLVPLNPIITLKSIENQHHFAIQDREITVYKLEFYVKKNTSFYLKHLKPPAVTDVIVPPNAVFQQTSQHSPHSNGVTSLYTNVSQTEVS